MKRLLQIIALLLTLGATAQTIYAAATSPVNQEQMPSARDHEPGG